MLTVISPAKTLDYETPPTTRKATQPALLDKSATLVKDARQLSPRRIASLMGISDKLAALNHERFQQWGPPFNAGNSKQAVLAFKGDVYVGLDADSLSAEDLDFAQKHLRILSGLYGLLRPLDRIQPYRLEMGLKFANSGGGDLYEFWGEDIVDALNKQLAGQNRVLVNLASNEYFKAVQPSRLKADVVTPVFKDKKGNGYRVISFFAKKARGMMARYIIEKRLDDPAGIKRFRRDGYRYNKAESTDTDWVFTRG